MSRSLIMGYLSFQRARQLEKLEEGPDNLPGNAEYVFGLVFACKKDRNVHAKSGYFSLVGAH